MSLLSFLRKKPVDEELEVVYIGCESFDVELVGEASYQATIAAAAKAATTTHRDFPVVDIALIREPENPHDPNAIAAYASGFGTVGYIPRASASTWAAFFDKQAAKGIRYGCRAIVTGGPARDRDSYGVVLNLDAWRVETGDAVQVSQRKGGGIKMTFGGRR